MKNPYESPGTQGTHWDGCARYHSACAWEEGRAAGVAEAGQALKKHFSLFKDRHKERMFLGHEVKRECLKVIRRLLLVTRTVDEEEQE